MIITSNRSFAECGGVLGDDVFTTAILDCLVYHFDGININDPSYRLKNRLALAAGGEPMPMTTLPRPTRQVVLEPINEGVRGYRSTMAAQSLRSMEVGVQELNGSFDPTAILARSSPLGENLEKQAEVAKFVQDQ